MAIDGKIRDQKLKNDINREAAKIPELSWRKIDKYESLTGEVILPSNKSQIIENGKFTYSPLEKALENQIKKQFHPLNFLNLSNKIDKLNKVTVYIQKTS